MLFVFLPIIFFVLFAVIIPIVARRKQPPVNAEQTKSDPTFRDGQQAKPQTPVRPPMKPTVKPTPKPTPAPRVIMEGPPERQRKAPDDAVAVQTAKAQEQQPFLAFTGNDAVKGILYAEILGKPKALQKT